MLQKLKEIVTRFLSPKKETTEENPHQISTNSNNSPRSVNFGKQRSVSFNPRAEWQYSRNLDHSSNAAINNNANNSFNSSQNFRNFENLPLENSFQHQNLNQSYNYNQSGRQSPAFKQPNTSHAVKNNYRNSFFDNETSFSESQPKRYKTTEPLNYKNNPHQIMNNKSSMIEPFERSIMPREKSYSLSRNEKSHLIAPSPAKEIMRRLHELAEKSYSTNYKLATPKSVIFR